MSGKGLAANVQKKKLLNVDSYDGIHDPTFVGTESHREISTTVTGPQNLIAAGFFITPAGVAGGLTDFITAGGTFNLPGTRSLLQALIPVSSNVDVAPGEVRSVNVFFRNSTAQNVSIIPGDGNTSILGGSLTLPPGTSLEAAITFMQMANGGTQPAQISIAPVGGSALPASTVISTANQQPFLETGQADDCFYVNGAVWAQAVTNGIPTQFSNSAAPISYEIIAATKLVESQLPSISIPIPRNTLLVNMILHVDIEGVALTAPPTGTITTYLQALGTGTAPTAVASALTGGGTVAGHYNLRLTPTLATNSLVGGASGRTYLADFILPANTGTTVRILGYTINYTKEEIY